MKKIAALISSLVFFTVIVLGIINTSVSEVNTSGHNTYAAICPIPPPPPPPKKSNDS